MDDVHLSTARHFCYELSLRRKIFSSNLERGKCAAAVKERLVKQRLEFSTFLHINFVKMYACNSNLNEDYVPSNTMCMVHLSSAPVARAARRSLSCIDRARAIGTNVKEGLGSHCACLS